MAPVIKLNPVSTPSKKRGAEEDYPTPPNTFKKPRMSQGLNYTTNSNNSLSPCRHLRMERSGTLNKIQGTRSYDDINKVLFIHPTWPKIHYTGKWAAAKLKEEILKYEKVKAFWLFENRDDYFPSYDDKYYFVADVYYKELQSTWVLAWMKELIGEEKFNKLVVALGEKLAVTDNFSALDQDIMEQ